MNIDKQILALCSKKLAKNLRGKDWSKSESIMDRLRRVEKPDRIGSPNIFRYTADYDEAKALSAAIKDGVTYDCKLPGQDWDAAQPRWISLDQARQNIECLYRPGYTPEPYVQLIEITSGKKRVVAEWMPGKGWTGALEAAGFVSHSV